MALDKLVWGIEESKEFEVEIKGQKHKIVLRPLNTIDTLQMNLAMITQENPDTKALLGDAIEMLSRSIVSIDGQTPDSQEEIKQLLLTKTQAGDVFKILGKFQSLGEAAEEEIKN